MDLPLDVDDLPIRTPDRIRTIRRIAITPGVQVVATDEVSAWFSGEIVPPDKDSESLDPGPTRSREPHLARWADSTIGPGVLAPDQGSERVESGSLTYELLGTPRKLYNGRRPVGVEVAVMPLGDLYPESAELQDQGGTRVLEHIPMALWEDATSRSGEGMYYTYTAECPIEYSEALLVKNCQLVINNIQFRIVDPFIFFEVPRVRMTLRGPR